MVGKIDLHMHSTLSDGTDTPEQLLQKVIGAGIGVFSVTDHDGVKAGQILPALLLEGGPRFIPGVEFSCRDEGGKYHVLGYGFDPAGEAVNAVVERGHTIRMNKVMARLDALKAEHGFTFPQEEIDRLLALDNPGKPHIGNLMVKYGYAQSKEEAIEQVLNPIRTPKVFIRPEEAIAGILGSGGVPVLAHPFYGSGDELILGAEMEERLTRLVGFGLKGIEAFYSGFSEKMRQQALALADRFDLLVTAGSDYHGTNKMVALADTGLPDEVPERLQKFLESV